MQTCLMILGVLYVVLTIFCTIKLIKDAIKISKELDCRIDILNLIWISLCCVFILCADYICGDDEDE